MAETIKLYTVCMIVSGDKILLLNRQHDSFRGYISPGGRIEFPESPTECAIREVKEETGLTVSNLVYKGLAEYMNPGQERYMIFNYITYDFTGELLQGSREGKPEWVALADLETIEMQENIRKRIPLFFDEGTFEIHVNRCGA
ncbi:8-oxo-dGTP diphosphatase [Paenibacillus sp. sgz500958]|uniref:8-oxo-dGTP diphosphatase n=1 Tax=Paenibacillus sp. sgz500958 TaxID=3242475 RepID=UPI0036D34476